MRVVRGDRVLLAGERLKIDRVFRRREDETGTVTSVFGLEEIDQPDRRAVVVIEPDTRSFDLEERAAVFGDRPEGSGEIATIERVALCELPERFLITLQQNRRIFLRPKEGLLGGAAPGGFTFACGAFTAKSGLRLRQRGAACLLACFGSG